MPPSLFPPSLFPHLPDQGAKICGIRTPEDYHHCVAVGAAFIGMVFFEKSPRHLRFDDAKILADCAVADGPVRVALCVNPTDDYLNKIIDYARPDMIQLHGDETPERTAAIKALTDLPIMKAFRVANKGDIAAAKAYYDVADWLLFDAYSGNPDMPGGTGHSFDWHLASDLNPPLPWMLAGGLTPDNLAQAKAQTNATYFDVSSAVEAEKGVKNHALITRFVQAVK